MFFCRHEFSRRGRQSDRFTHPRLSHYEEEGENPSIQTVNSDVAVILMGFFCNFYSTTKLSNCRFPHYLMTALFNDKHVIITCHYMVLSLNSAFYALFNADCIT